MAHEKILRTKDLWREWGNSVCVAKRHETVWLWLHHLHIAFLFITTFIHHPYLSYVSKNLISPKAQNIRATPDWSSRILRLTQKHTPPKTNIFTEKWWWSEDYFLLKRSLSREKLLIFGRVVTGNFLLTLHFVLFPPIFSTTGLPSPRAPGPPGWFSWCPRDSHIPPNFGRQRRWRWYHSHTPGKRRWKRRGDEGSAAMVKWSVGETSKNKKKKQQPKSYLDQLMHFMH